MTRMVVLRLVLRRLSSYLILLSRLRVVPDLDWLRLRIRRLVGWYGLWLVAMARVICLTILVRLRVS